MAAIPARLPIAALLAALSLAAGAAPRMIAGSAPDASTDRPTFAVAGDVLFFRGADGEPWRSDGTAAGTARLAKLAPENYASFPESFAEMGGAIHFMANDGTGQALWKSAGTAQSTVKVAPMEAAYGFTAAGNTLYFFRPEAVNETSAWSLWRSDGTPAGTARVREGFNPRGGQAALGFGIAANARVVFAADDGTNGWEPWASDGTASGTVLLRDIVPGGAGTRIERFASGAGKVYFAASGADGAAQLWVTDGTPAGTIQLTSAPPPGIAGDFSRNLAVIGGTAYFAGADEAGFELWRSDGTLAGTYRLVDLCPGACSSTPSHMTAMGDALYFVAQTASGRDLWKSDGTAAGTLMLKDLPASALPHSFTVAANRLFFVANDGVAGDELWISDGTPGGTTLRADLTPGTNGTFFPWMAAAPRGLFFATQGTGSRRDLWFDEIEACPPGDGDGDGVPGCIEVSEGLDPGVKDNDVFASARLFAMQQYRDFLGREGDGAGVTFWTGQLAGGAQDRARMVQAFFDSAEFQGRGAPVVQLYFAYLLRIPDYAGLDYWIARHRAGESLEGISDAFASSPEFFNRYGALDNAGFVDRVYRNVMGRPPDAPGMAYWKGRLDAGMTRGQVMLAFSESDEYRALIAHEVYVTMLYAGMLRRAPDAGGFSYWVGYLDAGNAGLALIQGFIDSREYRARFLP